MVSKEEIKVLLGAQGMARVHCFLEWRLHLGSEIYNLWRGRRDRPGRNTRGVAGAVACASGKGGDHADTPSAFARFPLFGNGTHPFVHRGWFLWRLPVLSDFYQHITQPHNLLFDFRLLKGWLLTSRRRLLRVFCDRRFSSYLLFTWIWPRTKINLTHILNYPLNFK